MTRLKGQHRRRTERDHRHALARCLLEYRDASGLTTRQLGDVVGVSQMTISNWCTSHRTPPADHLLAYLEAVGVGPSQLEADMEALGWSLPPASPLGPVWWVPEVAA